MFRRLLRDYLSLTRGERRGMQILSLLVILLLAFRSVLPLLIPSEEPDLTFAEKKFISFHDSILSLVQYKPAGSTYLDGSSYPGGSTNLAGGSSLASGSNYAGSSNSAGALSGTELFPFDPNTASMNDLLRLGIPVRPARTLIKYRDAGGEFRRDSDLLRVYGLEMEVYRQLEDFIRIAPDSFAAAGMEVQDSSGFSAKMAGSPGKGLSKDIELNQADSLQLLSVYGIGPVFAGRIIRYRSALGGFHKPEQLLEVYGINPLQFQQILQRSYLDTSLMRKLDLNRVEEGDLSFHPYLDRYQALSIIHYRELQGDYENPDELLENRLLPDSVFRRIRPYLSAGR